MIIRSLLISIILCQGLAGCATSQGTASAVEEIRRTSDRLWAAHEAGDATTMSALVTEDAVLMVPEFPDVIGREAIRAAAEGMFASTRIENFTVNKREIRVIGNEAYEVAWYSEVLRPVHGDPQTLQGRYLIVWKRSPSGEWLVHRNLFNFANATGH